MFSAYKLCFTQQKQNLTMDTIYIFNDFILIDLFYTSYIIVIYLFFGQHFSRIEFGFDNNFYYIGIFLCEYFFYSDDFFSLSTMYFKK